jgi:hypothetical protein
LRFNGLSLLLILFVSITAARGADNEKSRLNVRAAAEYPHRQTSEKVTIAAQTYETDEQAREAFGKVNPYRLGILPVLIVVQNEGSESIRLEGMQVSYVLPDRTRIQATPAQDLRFIHGPSQPRNTPKPLGGIGIGKAPKNPLAEWEIEGRAFAAKMLPPGQSASGFVYFQVPLSSQAASVYISGLVNAVSGNELYYFEIPMSGKPQ